MIWQPVGDGAAAGDWAHIAHGRYRFVVEGQARVTEGGQIETYQLELPEFEIIPTSIHAHPGDMMTVLAYPESPLGYRARGNAQEPTAASPLPAGMVLTVTCRHGELISAEAEVTVEAGGSVALALPDDGSTCSLRDPYGNGGLLQ